MNHRAKTQPALTMKTHISTPRQLTGGPSRLANIVFHRLLLASALSVTTLPAAEAANYALNFDGTNDHVQAPAKMSSNVMNNFTQVPLFPWAGERPGTCGTRPSGAFGQNTRFVSEGLPSTRHSAILMIVTSFSGSRAVNLQSWRHRSQLGAARPGTFA